jgi:hypothetical protein
MNPEFQRNLWLEASPRRAAWVAISLVLVYAAVALVSRDGVHRAAWFSGAGVAVFVVCAVVWAGRVAATSVLSEVAERTWDFQRLSALGAWQMTWGKLFGATLLASGAGLSGIVVFLASGPGVRNGWTLLLMLAVALLVQCLSFMAALVGVRKARAEGRLARAGGVAGGLILAYLLLSGLAADRVFHGLVPPSALGLLGARGGALSWWGMTPSHEVFWSLTALAFALFALAGAWRLMRLELQMAGEPVVWPIFLVFLAVWVAGFSAGPLGYGAAISAATMAMCLSAYAAAFVEPADRVGLRRFARFVMQGKAPEATRVAPALVLPTIFAVILALIGFGLQSAGPVADRASLAGPLLAFLVRDLGVIALFRFGPRPQRGDFGALVALALLYGVGGIVGRAMGGVGTAIFTPTAGDFAVLSIVSALGQAAIAWVLAARRIRAPETSVSAPPSGPASAPA